MNFQRHSKAAAVFRGFWQHAFSAALLTIACSTISLAQAASEASSAPRSCQTADGVKQLCGLVGPEDIALLKDGHTLIASELPADFGHPRGPGLMLVDLNSNTSQALAIKNDFEAGWGDASCKAPPAEGFSTHGLSLSTRSDGRTQLLAVNHAGGDSIQAFELKSDKNGYQAVWHGCAPFNGGLFNGVATLPEGGFVATVMLDGTLLKDQNPMDFMLSGKKTGYLVEWHFGKGYTRLPQSEAPVNNGVQASKDGRFIYFTSWTGRQILRYDRAQMLITASIDTPFYPDNISQQPDGSLLVTGIDDMAAFHKCSKAEGGFCSKLLAFTVAKFDADKMQVTPYYRGAKGMLAGGSVGLKVGNRLIVGTFTGDRLISIKAP